jgi:ribosome biogenesis protein ENP2
MLHGKKCAFIPFLFVGIYKPRLRCYDLHNLGLKFERCLDAEVVTFEILSDDYSKVSKIATFHFRSRHCNHIS